MRLLLVAATDLEVAPLRTALAAQPDVQIVVTGVGMVATAARVARALSRERFDLALNVGVCGALDRGLSLGAVVHVASDYCSELGVEDGPVFIAADRVGLVGADEAPYRAGRLHNLAPPASPTLASLPVVSGITVNTVHGDDGSIAALRARCDAQVESMEGAAFMYACLDAGLPFAQVRAVSNYVERRNRATWQMEAAIGALSRTTMAIVSDLVRASSAD
jgi:futalosine hydrolase